jgi:NTP pyrophosphatase (non-canonical NTP hydrolase)
MTIRALCAKSHENAVAHGWWGPNGNDKRNFCELIALMHSELSEALEEYRGENDPEHIAEEFADVLIRVGDACGALGLDLEDAVVKKMEKNKARPYRHGNKRA